MNSSPESYSLRTLMFNAPNIRPMIIKLWEMKSSMMGLWIVLIQRSGGANKLLR